MKKMIIAGCTTLLSALVAGCGGMNSTAASTPDIDESPSSTLTIPTSTIATTAFPSSTATTASPSSSMTTIPSSSSNSSEPILKTPSHVDNPHGEFFDLKESYEAGLLSHQNLVDIAFRNNGYLFLESKDTEEDRPYSSTRIDTFYPVDVKVSPIDHLNPDVEEAIAEDGFYYFVQGTTKDAALDPVYGKNIGDLGILWYLGRYGDYYAVMLRDWNIWPATSSSENIGGIWFHWGYANGEHIRLWKPFEEMDPLEFGEEKVLHNKPEMWPDYTVHPVNQAGYNVVYYDRAPGDPADLLDLEYVWTSSDPSILAATAVGSGCLLESGDQTGTVTLSLDVSGWHLETEIEVFSWSNPPTTKG